MNIKDLKKYSTDALTLARELFPINRSISNIGVKKSLQIIGRDHKSFKIKSFTAQSKAYDWKVSKRWNVKF